MGISEHYLFAQINAARKGTEDQISCLKASMDMDCVHFIEPHLILFEHFFNFVKIKKERVILQGSL